MSRVQYFNVVCSSGHRVRGERTEGYQALRCPACGDGVFVLPRSPLPEPVAPERPARPRVASVRQALVDEGPVELSDPAIAAVDVAGDEPVATDAEIIWDDDFVEEPDRAAPAPTPLRSKGKIEGREAVGPGAAEANPNPVGRSPELDATAPPRVRSRPKGQAPSSPAERTPRTGDPTAPTHPRGKKRAVKAIAAAPADRRESPDQPSASVHGQGRVPRKGNRYHLIFWAVPVFVVATISFRYWQQKRQEYPLIAERGRIEGIPALDEGKFDRAYQLLSAAKAAVDALGGDVEDADAIRGAADEAAIFIDLSGRPLEEMLDEAGRTDPDTWATRFDNLYKSRSIIIDSWIASAPAAGSGPYDIDYRVFPSGGAAHFGDSDRVRPERTGVIDFSGFQLLELSRPGVGDRVRFGARLASFQYDGVQDLWVIRLEPNSGVFIQHSKALETLGWPSAPSIGRDAGGQP